MAEITASMVRDLRDKTDAPMMECKKALVEAEGNAAKAEELLRVRLGNKASRAATRTAAEGVVADHVAKRTPRDVAALASVPLGGSTVEETRKALVGRIGENMSIRRFARIE